MIGQRDRLALEFHLTRFDVLQIGGEQLQAVRVVAEQVGFDQDVGDVMGAILRHSGCDQQRLGELDQRGSVMARPGGGTSSGRRDVGHIEKSYQFLNNGF